MVVCQGKRVRRHSEIAGQASILISQRYVHPTPERLKDAFARLKLYNQARIEELKAKEAETRHGSIAAWWAQELDTTKKAGFHVRP